MRGTARAAATRRGVVRVTKASWSVVKNGLVDVERLVEPADAIPSPDVLEHGPGEIGARDIGIGQVGTGEVGPDEQHLAEVRAREIRTAEIDTGRIDPHDTHRLIPGVH